MKRIILETTESKKAALEQELKAQGKSISEWFHDKIEETVEEPLEQYKTTKLDITSLDQISDSNEVLSKLKKY